MSPYLVCEFGKSTISALIRECFGSEFSDVLSKPQLAYIFRYLKDIGAESVLLEREYLDKDYLEDYSRYYVKSFNNGGHKCARLHFFSLKDVNHQLIDGALEHGCRANNYDDLVSSYLGYMVVRPLPLTFIGKTCVKTYPTINQPKTEKVCLSRQYKVDLFGIPLTVDSVAFQEQDQVVAACATTAIWAALHATPWNNARHIPSCSEITTGAINYVQNSNNAFPNKGLSIKQILRALDVEGLRYYHEDVKKRKASELYETVRIHIDSGIPLILCADVFDYDAIKKEKGKERLGLHAVTIVGYSANSKGIYLHDDRLGPFAYGTLEPEGWALKRRNVDGQWLEAEELLAPVGLIIPTHKKIRIPYDQPTYACRFIASEWRKRISEGLTKLKGRKSEKEGLQKKADLQFELRLKEISTIRSHLINHSQRPTGKVWLEDKRKFLVGNYARWQWEAIFSQDNSPLFRLYFDATEIPQGNVISGIFIEKQKAAEHVLKYFIKLAMGASIKAKLDEEGSDFFLAFLRYLRKDKSEGWKGYLDKSYGQLRAPRYIKEVEIIDGDINANESRAIIYEKSRDPLGKFFGSDLKIIWAIGQEGELLLGNELSGVGHPTLTGFSPARIAGEIIKTTDGLFVINSKSGRYSRDYSNEKILLKNAVEKIRTAFPNDADNIFIEARKRNPRK